MQNTLLETDNLVGMSASKLNIISANIRGFNDKQKRGGFFLHIRKVNPDIVCLCDTRLNENQSLIMAQETNMRHFSSQVDRAARGVCILVKKSLPIKISNIEKSNSGNYVKIECNYDGNTFNLICIYGPNEDSPDFFSNIFNIITNSNLENSIIVGDFNVTLEPAVDNMHYAQNRNNNARAKLKDLMSQHGFVDAFRQIKGNKKGFTWLNPGGMQRARLDMAILSNAVLPFISNFQHLVAFKSDHKPIMITLDFDKFLRGKGYWKFNNALLMDREYIDLIKKSINDTCAKYIAHPQYNCFYSDANDEERERFSALSPEELQELDFSINPNLMYEMLLNDIKNATVAFSVNKKRRSNEEEKKLHEKVQRLQRIKSSGENIENIDEELKTAELNYEHFMDQKYIKNTFLKDVKIRKEGELPTPYLCSLEKNMVAQKYISRLKVQRDGKEKIITNQREIESETAAFYQKLFECRDNGEKVGEIKDFLQNDEHSFYRLSEQEANHLEGLLTEGDVLKTLKKTKNDTAPGLTGLTYAFYKFFWRDLKHFFIKMANFSYEHDLLPSSLRKGVITLLPKGDKPTDQLKNLRPVTLLPAEYKLISGSIANRINEILPLLINEQQVGFVKNRFIGECIRTTYDTFERANLKKITGMLLLIDFEKAFDSVSFTYIEKMLGFFGFGNQLIKWVNLLLHNFSACINLAGNLTALFQVLRGARQGDPIASPIFVMAIEILCIKIRNSPTIRPYRIENLSVLLSLFADDMSIFLEYNSDNLRSAVRILNNFFLISGLKIQVEKTQVIVFGPLPQREYRLCPEINLKWEQSFTLLGIDFDPSLKNMASNFEKKVAEIIKTISYWKNRYLTPLGKVVVTKTLLLSKLAHVALVLPALESKRIKDLEGIIYNYIWSGRDKVAREDAKKSFKNGGLNMPDIMLSWKAFKLGWLRRLFTTTATWGNIFEASLRDAFPQKSKNDCFFNFGSFDILAVAKNIPSAFWKEVFKVLKNFLPIYLKQFPEKVLFSTIWNSQFFMRNRNACNKRQFPSLRHISMPADIISNNGNNSYLMSPDELCRRYGERGREEYISMRVVIIQAAQKLGISVENISVEQPFLPLIVDIAQVGRKGCNYWTKIMKSAGFVTKSIREKEENWEVSLGRVQGIPFWNDCYKKVEDIFYDNKLKVFYYKIVRGTLYTNRIVHNFGHNVRPECSLCEIENETILHLMWECPVTDTFFDVAHDLIFEEFPIFRCEFSKKEFIFGFRQQPIYSPANLYVLLCKRYIWISKCQKKRPTYINFINWFKKEIRLKKACFRDDKRLIYLAELVIN